MLQLENLTQIHLKNTFFRFKKFSNSQYLITNDIGRYAFLSIQEFGDFIYGKLDTNSKKYIELVTKGFIKSENYENQMSLSFLKKNYFVGYGPSLHIIVTTLRCNHACQYCHASVVGNTDITYDMSIETAKSVVDTIFYTNSKGITIEFQGGESLMNFETVKFIVEYAKTKALHLNKNLSFALVSNLTLLDDKKLEFLLKNNVGVSTSLDGDELLHNTHRQFPAGNSFKIVTSQIQKLQKAYKKCERKDSVGALLTVSKKTFPRFKEIVDTYIQLGLDSIYLRPLNPYGFAAKKIDELGYSHQEFIDFYTKTLDYILELNKKGISLKEGYASIFLHKILTDSDPNFLDTRSPCGACIGQVAYNYDGKIYTCDEGRMFSRMQDESFQIAEVGKDASATYQEMMNSDTTKVMVQASTLDGLPGYNEHVYKPYLGVCPISAYKASGSIISQFPKDTRTKIDIGVLDYIFTKIQDPENTAIFENWLGIKNPIDTLNC